MIDTAFPMPTLPKEPPGETLTERHLITHVKPGAPNDHEKLKTRYILGRLTILIVFLYMQ